MNEIMESIESMRWVLLGTGVALWLWFAYVVGPYLWRWWRGRREPKDTAWEPVRWPNRGVWIGSLRLMCREEPPSQPSGNPGELPDHKYQGDQVSGLRGELLALEERVGKLERGNSLCIQPRVNMTALGNYGGVGNVVGKQVGFTGGGSDFIVPVTPAPVEAGVRVFRWTRPGVLPVETYLQDSVGARYVYYCTALELDR